jgi:putative chitinase
LLNGKFFFDTARLRLFDGKLKATQVAGLSAILDEWEEHHAGKDDRWLAYVLATVHHETDRTMQPIKEYGGQSYFFRMYDPEGERPHVASRLGNTEPGDGARFCGRGYVQLTGRRNYADWSNRLALPLVDDPDLCLQSTISIKILFTGMELGTFTGKKLADYLSESKEDWIGARRIINGQDKASLIGSHARNYYSALSYTVA